MLVVCGVGRGVECGAGAGLGRVLVGCGLAAGRVEAGAVAGVLAARLGAAVVGTGVARARVDTRADEDADAVADGADVAVDVEAEVARGSTAGIDDDHVWSEAGSAALACRSAPARPMPSASAAQPPTATTAIVLEAMRPKPMGRLCQV